MLGYLLSPVLQIEDINGLPLVNGKVYVYEANTSNLATIYSNYEGTLNTNPAILDLAGHTTIIADDEMMYDITVKDKDDNLLFSAKDIAVGGEGGSAIVSDVTVRASGNGISVVQSVENNTKVFTVSIDYNFVASKTDLNSKQNTLTPGANISISGDTIAVTGLKTINVTSPLQKTETPSGINLSIDPSGIQTPLSAGTNIDEVKLSNGIVDLKHDNCSASINSIAIGHETIASGNCSFAEGLRTSAFGDESHSEGDRTQAIGYESHSEGYITSAIGYQSHSEGAYTQAIGHESHAEGESTIASGNYSHAEGQYTIASGIYSHAEGYKTSAIGPASHAEGESTIASGAYQTVIGKYNAPNTTDLFQIGCGSADNARQNAVEIKKDNTIVVGYNNNLDIFSGVPYVNQQNIFGNNNTLYAGNIGETVSGNTIVGNGNNLSDFSAKYDFFDNFIIGNSNNTNVSSDFRQNTILGHKNVISGSNSTYNSITESTIIGTQNTAYDNGNGFYNLTILGHRNLFSGNNGYGTTILGQSNEVKGNATHCTFGGYSNKINGSISNSIIHGYYNEYKISGGYEALALGVFGYRNKITANDHADGSFIAGYENNIALRNADALICLGNTNNVDSSAHCYVLGDSNTISGGQMYAIGSNNNTTGNTIQSYVFGASNAINNTTNAMAIGFTNTVSSNNTIRIGFGGSTNNCFIEITPDHIYAVKNNTTVTII